MCVFQRGIPITSSPVVVKLLKDEVSLSPHDLTNAYFMYVGLLQTDYSFFCVKCGHFPPVLEFDGCRKTVTEIQSKFKLLH